MGILANFKSIKDSLSSDITLVAVSKTKPASMIMEIYSNGHLDFGENKVQDLVAKYEDLPKDIKWHMIGHLQSNKVKYIAPFVHLIHGVDSLKLLRMINKEGSKNDRIIPCLLQVHIAEESTKFGFDEAEIFQILGDQEFQLLKNIEVKGLMGMATYTNDSQKVKSEFRNLKCIFEKVKKELFADSNSFSVLSMGMSDDFQLAVDEGSTMIRIGSLIFGPRNY